MIRLFDDLFRLAHQVSASEWHELHFTSITNFIKYQFIVSALGSLSCSISPFELRFTNVQLWKRIRQSWRKSFSLTLTILEFSAPPCFFLTCSLLL